MRIIDLDASSWVTPLDFMSALKRVLGSPDWHGDNLNAFIDSMIWGGINAVNPPYLIRVFDVVPLHKDLFDYIRLASEALQEAREEHLSRKGYDVDVTLVIPQLSH